MPFDGAMTLDAPTLDNAFVRLEPLEERHRAALSDVAADPDLWRFESANRHYAWNGPYRPREVHHAA